MSSADIPLSFCLILKMNRLNWECLREIAFRCYRLFLHPSFSRLPQQKQPFCNVYSSIGGAGRKAYKLLYDRWESGGVRGGDLEKAKFWALHHSPTHNGFLVFFSSFTAKNVQCCVLCVLPNFGILPKNVYAIIAAKTIKTFVQESYFLVGTPKEPPCARQTKPGFLSLFSLFLFLRAPPLTLSLAAVSLFLVGPGLPPPPLLCLLHKGAPNFVGSSSVGGLRRGGGIAVFFRFSKSSDRSRRRISDSSDRPLNQVEKWNRLPGFLLYVNASKILLEIKTFFKKKRIDKRLRPIRKYLKWGQGFFLHGHSRNCKKPNQIFFLKVALQFDSPNTKIQEKPTWSVFVSHRLLNTVSHFSLVSASNLTGP